MLLLLAIALLVWIGFIAIGLVVKGLFWLTVLGAGAFIATVIAGVSHHRNEETRT